MNVSWCGKHPHVSPFNGILCPECFPNKEASMTIEQPQEVQAVINEAYAQLKLTVEAAEEAHEGAGQIALALLGTERSE